MNKKLLGFALAFVFLAMLATPLVSAKPTSAANNPKSISFLWHSENGGGPDPELKVNPPWAEEGSPDVKVTHGQRDWELNPDFNNYIQIGEESESNPPITIYADHYEGNLYVQSVAKSPTSSALNYRVYEKIMWGDDNYIEIMCLERANMEILGVDPGTGLPIVDFYASGIFSGHGVVDGQKVQVTGIREGSFVPMIGFVLECYGTIRFAGKA
jgi:hypothetical protein